MALEKKIFLKLLPLFPPPTIHTHPRSDKFDTQGHGWHDLCSEPLYIDMYYIYTEGKSLAISYNGFFHRQSS